VSCRRTRRGGDEILDNLFEQFSQLCLSLIVVGYLEIVCYSSSESPRIIGVVQSMKFMSCLYLAKDQSKLLSTIDNETGAV